MTAHQHRRTHFTITLLAALILVAALVAACSAQASGGAPAGDTPSAISTTAGAVSAAAGDAAGAKGASGADWSRVLAALAWMRSEKPTKPVVVLLGGSAARESTISDSSWRSQIAAKSAHHTATLAWNMGSRNRTMAQNVAIVKALPKVPTIVYIGINLGSFTSAQKTATAVLPSPAPTSQPKLQQPHSYSTKTGILSTTKKRALVKKWLAGRYPVYKRNFASSASVLTTLIKVCKTRGFKPVLFELPRNTAVIGSALNAPITKYRNKCRQLATKYRIPWVSFVSSAKLRNSNFYDLWHLVEPGRKKWQNLLSAKTAALLKKYDYDGGGS